ncbi:MAG: trypsin-like peptidase domain-containing protein [Caulobacterales bacterium]|nr:trypsin-like peptidase domain-containing protein [Caulobacterales bacterium]
MGWRQFGAVAIVAVLAGSGTAIAQPALPIPFDAERGVFSFADQIERSLPAVVRVTTLNRASTAGARPREIAGGSGVIIDAGAGIVITNQHVVDGGNTFRVDLTDGRSFDAELLGADDATDVAVLRISAQGLSQVEIADSDRLRTGDLVFAVGHPLGLDQTLTMGVVSGLGRSGIGDAIEDYIQTDAAVNSGNSGGPLLDSAGRLIGINTAILSGGGGGNDGLAFAVPSRILMVVVHQLREAGQVSRGRIGVTMGSLTAERARLLGTPIIRGAVIEDVAPGSAADRAGLRRNDVIVGMAGRTVESSGGVTSVVGLAQPGSSLDVRFLRDGIEQQTTVVVEETAPVAVQVAAAGDAGQAFGAGFRSMRSTDRPVDGVSSGVLITYVEPGSVAAASGLMAGDVVVRANTSDVTSADHLATEIRENPDGVQLMVIRGSERLPISLRPA